MAEDLLKIPRNPRQTPPSLFRVTRSLKVRGDAIYIIFAGIAGSVFLFFITMEVSLLLALAVSWMPLLAAVWFYFKFVREKPKFFFDYVLNSIFGRTLISPKHPTYKLERKFYA